MEDIKHKLNYFVRNGKIPHIIFHGSSCVGKRTLLLNFISQIYDNDKDIMKQHVMNVNCAYGKGIKFIRDELKFYAKSNSLMTNGVKFKCIVLSNADNLTMDAQSALRRCIELFSHNTRFFMIVENKYKLLNPILSRFCQIYVPEQVNGGRIVEANKKYFDEEKIMELGKRLIKYEEGPQTYENLTNLIHELYGLGIHCLHFIRYLKKQTLTERIGETIIEFDKVRREFKHEKMMFLYIFNYYYFVQSKNNKTV